MRLHSRSIIFLFLLGCSFHALAEKAPVVDATALSSIEQRLARMERLLQNQGLLDLLQQVEKLQSEVGRLRGEIEVQNHNLEQLKQKQQKLYTDVDRRIQQLQAQGNGQPGTTLSSEPPPLQTLPTETAASPDTGQPPTEPALSVETTVVQEEGGGMVTAPEADAPEQPTTTGAATQAGDSTSQTDPIQARAAYQNAFKYLKEAQYEQAIEAFTQYLNEYPRSEYADNAQYWLGETYYVTHNYDAAINAYNQLITDYPESRKVAHGLLKLGYSYQELGQLEQARQQLEELKAKYPGTTAARLASERLRTIKIPDTSNDQTNESNS